MRALIVDDDPAMSGLMRRCFTAWGWTAEECGSISAALELLKRGQYDLAVCDVDLPDGDGIFLACALSKARPALRIVMISGDPRNIIRARAAGIELRLQKPFDLDALKALADLRSSPAKEPATLASSPLTGRMGGRDAITFILPESDWYAARVEILWGQPLGGKLFKIRNAPFYAYGCSLGDVVAADRDVFGRFVFEKVVERGGHSTYRLIASKGKEERFQKYWAPLARLDCGYERTGRLYAVDAPPNADINRVLELLAKGRSDEAWEFETGWAGQG